MRKLIALILAILLVATSNTYAQSTPNPNGVNGPVKQVGPVTANHCVAWNGNNYIKDSGAACGGGGSLVAPVDVGTPAITDTGVLLQATSSTNSYNQFIIQNTNSGATASSNYVVNNNLGTATTYYGEFGMNSSGFTGSGAFNQPSEVYLDSKSSDLALGTLGSNAIHFVVNSGTTDSMTISSAGAVSIPAFGTAGVVLNNSSGVLSSTAGALPIANGGTGATTVTAGLTNTLGSLANYTSGQINYFLQNNAGTWVALAYFYVGGQCSFNAYMVGTTGSLPAALTDQSTNAQNFLLDCQIKALQLGTANFDNVVAEKMINAIIERNVYNATRTIVVPDLVRLHDYAGWTRESSSGNCTYANFWDGSCKNLSNLYYPIFEVSHGAEVDGLTLYAENQSGGNNGTAVWFGRGWEAGDCHIGTPGTGYTGTDTPVTVNPEKVGSGATITITVSGGVPQTCALSSGVRFNALNGVYGLPFLLRKSQWSNAAFIAASGVTTFDSSYGDGSTAYKTTGGTGTGLSVYFNEYPDWCSGSAGTDFISCTLSNIWEGVYSQTADQLEVTQRGIDVFGAGTTNSGTYGPMYSIGDSAQNVSFENSYTQGGYYGLYDTAAATDVRFINPYAYAAGTGVFSAGANSTYKGIIIDTPTATCFDRSKGYSLNADGICFGNNTNVVLSSNPIIFGDGGSSVVSSIFNMSLLNVGPNTAINANYLYGGNDINVTVINAGNTETNPHFVTFGANNNPTGSNILRGTIDGVTATNICQNASNSAGIGMRIWDGNDSEWISSLCNVAGLNSVAYSTHGTYTWTAPSGVSQAVVCGRGGSGGGGGGGAGGGGSTAAGAAGGGAGGTGGSTYSSCQTLTVTPGTAYTLTVGAGGASAAGGTQTAANASGSTGGNGTSGNSGGNTTFGSLWTWIGAGGGGNGYGGSLSTGGGGGYGGSDTYGNASGGGGSGSAANTAGSPGSNVYANSPYASAGGNGSGGTGGGTGGGGGGGGMGQPAGGDSGGSGGTAANGGAGGASGSNGTGGGACNASTGGFGGQGGTGGGGGGLKATTGSQGGVGQAGCAGVDGIISVSWVQS